jgi:hypothetical protein
LSTIAEQAARRAVASMVEAEVLERRPPTGAGSAEAAEPVPRPAP